jgi:deoxycytidylate deaminase
MELIEIKSADETDVIWATLKGVADKSTMKFKIGSALVKRGRILAVGNNSRKTHPKYGSKKEYMTLHAEGSVIYNANKLGIDTKGCTIIVYRRGGLNSKPCPSCQKLIEKAGITKVIYTNYE